MEEKIDRIEKAVAQNTKSIDTLVAAVTQNTKDISDLIEIVGAIKDNMVTKDEFTQELEKMATKKDLGELEERLTGKIEGVQRAVDSSFERQS